VVQGVSLDANAASAIAKDATLALDPFEYGAVVHPRDDLGDVVGLVAIKKRHKIGIRLTLCLHSAGSARLALYFLDLKLYLLCRCTSLTMLNIGGCERVGGSSIAQLIENCPRLVDMDLTQCHHLTDTNLRAMAPYFTQIQKIRLGYCRNVTEEGFRDVARFCFELVHADVRGLRKLSDGSVVKLSQVARWLSHLDIRGCQGISKDGIDKVSRNLEMCSVVYSRVG
jgi:hypothetical protein